MVVMADSIERIAGEMDEAAVAYAGHHSSGTFRRLATRLRAISPAGGDLVMVPRDLLTHLGDWKVAVTAVYRNSQADLDSTEASYWKHQLETIIRIETMLAAAPQPQDTAAPSGECSICPDDMLHAGPCNYTQPTPADESGAGLVGIASIPPGGDGATTRALFDARTVPPGTKLYASGQTLAGAGGDEVVARAFEERDHAKEQLRLLSEEMVYDGNSVSWIASKAKNYGNALLEAWDALKSVGVPCDGQTTVADAIRKHFATSAGTTGDDSEDAALPYLSEQMQGFLRVHPFGYSHALGLLNEYARAARRAREVGNG